MNLHGDKMKKINKPKYLIMKVLMAPINLSALILGSVGIILLRAIYIANKLHIKLEAQEKAKRKQRKR
jgi:hypothetical protein